MRHSFIVAFSLTVWRILRCNRFARGGFDPVPPNPVEKRIIKVRSILDPNCEKEYIPIYNTAVIDP